MYRTLLELTAKLARMNLWDILDQFKEVMSLGQEIVIPLVIGSVVVGLVAALCAYLISYALIRYMAIRRNRKRKLL